MNFDLITASVRLRRKKAPMKTSGTKKMVDVTEDDFHRLSMIVPHPSKVTHWNIVIRELKILSKLLTPPSGLCTPARQ